MMLCERENTKSAISSIKVKTSICLTVGKVRNFGGKKERLTNFPVHNEGMKQSLSGSMTTIATRTSCYGKLIDDSICVYI